VQRKDNPGKAMTKTRTLLLTVAAGLLLMACNTIQGLGEDVESVGETVSDVAK
jgi:predicted small secreted protein